MEIKDILSFLGGLALFFYGMHMMSGGLEAAAGNYMKQILERLTANRFLGVAAGAVITAIIQSSSATMAMVVGFLSSGMITLEQAVWVIMGANLGTIVTGHLIAWNIGMMAPLFAFAGVILLLFLNKPKYTYAGQILAGLGVLFLGIEMIGTAMLPLQGVPEIIRLLEMFSSPLPGIFAGIVFTSVLHSSSASIGILQMAAVNGLVRLNDAAFFMFGQNIGTCVRTAIAAVGGKRDAQRAALIHFIFNIAGTCVLCILCLTTPVVPFLEKITPGKLAVQIAQMHTLFYVITTLLLFPTGTILAKATKKILPELKTDSNKEKHLKYLLPPGKAIEERIGMSAIYLNQLHQEVFRMLEMTGYNVDRAFWAFRVADEEQLEEVQKAEEYIDYLNKEISQYIFRTIVNKPNEGDAFIASQYYKMVGNMEQIGDHALNIAKYTSVLKEKEITFTREEQREMERMEQVLQVIFEALDKPMQEEKNWLKRVEYLEHSMGEMALQFREALVGRMKQGKCTGEACIVYSEMLTDFEHIGQHILNIAQEMQKVGEKSNIKHLSNKTNMGYTTGIKSKLFFKWR